MSDQKEIETWDSKAFWRDVLVFTLASIIAELILREGFKNVR